MVCSVPVQLFATPWTVAHQAPLCMEFSRWEYWNGLPFPNPGHLPNPGIEPTSVASPALGGRFFTIELPGSPVRPRSSSCLPLSRASLAAQKAKNLPAVQETWFPSLGWEDPLEKGMATYSSILAWRIPWTEEPGGSVGLQRVGHDWVTNTFDFHLYLVE